MADMLTTEETAQAAGLTVASLRSYVSTGRFPRPDGFFGRTPWWAPATVQEWLEQLGPAAQARRGAQPAGRLPTGIIPEKCLQNRLTPPPNVCNNAYMGASKETTMTLYQVANLSEEQIQFLIDGSLANRADHVLTAEDAARYGGGMVFDNVAGQELRGLDDDIDGVIDSGNTMWFGGAGYPVETVDA